MEQRRLSTHPLSPLGDFYLEGRLISSRAVVINGEPYVPVKDIATGLGSKMSFDRAAGIARIVKPGGAQQLQGAEGRIGQWLFSGRTRLLVRSVEYKEDRVIATIQIRNAMTETRTFYPVFSKFLFADAGDNVYNASPVNADSRDVLPGAALTVQIEATIPHGTKVTKLIVTLDIGDPDETFRIFLQ